MRAGNADLLVAPAKAGAQFIKNTGFRPERSSVYPVLVEGPE